MADPLNEEQQLALAQTAFVVNHIRPFAQLVRNNYWAAKAAKALWEQKQFDGKFPSDGTVIDDSVFPPITGKLVNLAFESMQAFVADLEANENAKLKQLLDLIQ